MMSGACVARAADVQNHDIRRDEPAIWHGGSAEAEPRRESGEEVKGMSRKWICEWDPAASSPHE